MEKLTIITPCSRPENLPALAASIEPGRALFDIYWRVVFDGAVAEHRAVEGAHTAVIRDYASISGNAQRNFALDCTEGGWVYFLDDDNAAHPELFKVMAGMLESDREAYAFQQQLPGYTRSTGPEYMRVGFVDMAQVFIRRDLIGTARFDLGVYEADGLFIQRLYWATSVKWAFIEKPLCYYNALREG